MTITRRQAIIGIGGMLAFPSILTAQSRRPKWFYDFKNPDRGPSRHDIALSGYDGYGRTLSESQIDSAEQYLIDKSVTPSGIPIIGDNGKVKYVLDESLSKNEVGNHPLLVYVGKSKEPIDMKTRANGSMVLKNVPYPSELRVVSAGSPEHIPSDIEYALLDKKNFIQMSLLEKTANLHAIWEIAFSREKGTYNQHYTPCAMFPIYSTNHSLKIREQNKPLEVKFILDEAYDTAFTRAWLMGKFRNEIIPGMTRGAIKVKGIEFVPTAELPKWNEIEQSLVVIGSNYHTNANTGHTKVDPKTYLIDASGFSLAAVEPDFPDKPNSVKGWESTAVQETLQSMGVLGEPKNREWNKNNPNSFCEGLTGDYNGDFPTEIDYECGKALHSQQPGTKMLGNPPNNFRFRRRIKLKNYVEQ